MTEEITIEDVVLESIRASMDRAAKSRKYACVLQECREWLAGMIEVMNNESADYNKSRPIGLFENAMQQLLIKIDEVLK